MKMGKCGITEKCFFFVLSLQSVLLQIACLNYVAKCFNCNKPFFLFVAKLGLIFVSFVANCFFPAIL